MSTPANPAAEGAPRSEQITLADGTVAELVERADGWALRVDGVVSSHVGAAGVPPALASVRWMLAALGGGRRTCAHLGGSLMTLPRAIAERDPAAVQVVVELDPVLAQLARDRFGVPPGVTVEVGDARAWLEAPSMRGLDAVVIDVFAGGRIPPAFTSLECFTAARAVLADTGVLVVNSVAAPDLTFTRRELATMQAVFGHVAMVVQGSALGGLRFGNATLIGSAAPLDTAAVREALAGDPSKGALVTDLAPIVDGADPVSDADGLWSPEPQLPRYDGALRLLDAARAAVRSALPPDRG